MEITEVKVKLMPPRKDKLRAFCSVAYDNCFVVHDIKVIEGVKGAFVAMPSRKLTDRCSKCGTKNHLRAKFCNECGTKLIPRQGMPDRNGRIKLHADIVHPINNDSRQMLQDKVLTAYEEELKRSKEPGYKPPDDVLSDEEIDEEA